MARLRVRLEVKRPEPGLPLDKLAELAERAQKLVRIVGREAPLGSDGYWVARNFREGSLGFDVEFIGEADDDQIRHYNQKLNQVVSYRPNDPSSPAPANVPTDVLVQYARVAEVMEMGESLQIGVYGVDAEAPQTSAAITKQESVAILEQLLAPVEYHGMIQGIIHSLFKESNPPHFDVRELATADLVRCYYTPPQYGRVAKCLARRDAVILVAGQVTANRLSRRVEEIRVERLEESRRLTEKEFERFFGCAPGLTGNLSTSTFISRVRRDGD